MLLKDKVTVVTGAAQGIGQACAERSAAEGSKVVVSDINADAGSKVAAAINGAGGRAVFIAADVAREADVKALIDGAVKAYGRIDVLINNAGIIDTADFLDLTVADLDRVLGVNLRGAFLVAQAAARVMVAQVKTGSEPGAIVNMSSANAHFGLPDHVAYSMSKGGIGQLTKAAAISLAPHGIRVNAIGPGTIATPMAQAVLTNDAARRKIMSRTPLGRLGAPSEIASIAIFLASRESSYVTGQTIFPDGGRMFLNYTVAVAD